MSVILVLCFLCGFVANLPTSFSLKCYTCHDYPGSSEPCSSPTVKQCDSYYDSCISFSATVEYYGMTIPTTYKDCMMSQVCNSTALCGHMTDNLPDSAVLKHCSVDCCHGDLCNAQAGGQAKRDTLLKLREKKREAKGRMLMRKPAKAIREYLANMALTKR